MIACMNPAKIFAEVHQGFDCVGPELFFWGSAQEKLQKHMFLEIYSKFSPPKQ